MKKFISVLMALCLSITLLIPLTMTKASAAGASLTGPGTVRAGDTITVSFNVSGSGIYGASGSLSYSGLTLLSTKQAIGGSWAVEFNGANFVAYDNALSSPISGGKTLFTATFKVNDVAAGTTVSASCNGITTTDGNADSNVGSASYGATVAPPLSGNTNLATLNVSNAKISPAFSKNVTKYTADVPFEVSKLSINATAEDSKSKVSVYSPNLTPDATTNVSVTVRAESGAKKTYVIAVHRAQDPNYKPGGNNNLSGIQVEGFLLSPVFKADLTKYVVWLPYETESVNITGTADDEKASVEVKGGDKLIAGKDNPVKVICTAENGDKKEYTVIVKRAAAHGAVKEEPTKPVEEKKAGVPWWSLLIVGVLTIVIGGAIGFFIHDPITNKRNDNYIYDEDDSEDEGDEQQTNFFNKQ